MNETRLYAPRKAIAFYLQAAKYAGDVPLSPHFKTPTVRTGTGTRKRGRPAANNNQGTGESTPQTGGIPTGLHPALTGLLGDIPKRGQTWTQQQHDDFMAAFTAVLKIGAPVSDDSDDDADADDDWEATE